MAFQTVIEDNKRALPTQLNDLRGIAMTGVPFDRGKLNLENRASRTKRLKQLFQELDFDLEPGHHRTMTQDSLGKVPRKFANSVSDWEQSSRGYLESKHL